MARNDHFIPPEHLRTILGEEGYQYLLQVHRHVYGEGVDVDGTLTRNNIQPVETLKTDETDTQKVLRPTGSNSALSFQDAPGINAKYVTLENDPELPNDRVATGGTNITITEDESAETATWDVSPQGTGSGLDADLLDAREAVEFVWGISKSGETVLQGANVTFSAGSGISLTQAANDIEIAATSADEVFSGWWWG